MVESNFWTSGMLLCTVTRVCVCVCGLNSSLSCFFQREEQAELNARQLAMSNEARRQIIELRKLKK